MKSNANFKALGTQAPWSHGGHTLEVQVPKCLVRFFWEKVQQGSIGTLFPEATETPTYICKANLLPAFLFATTPLENLTNYSASIIRGHSFVMVILYLASATSIVLASSVQHRKTEMQY